MFKGAFNTKVIKNDIMQKLIDIENEKRINSDRKLLKGKELNEFKKSEKIQKIVEEECEKKISNIIKNYTKQQDNKLTYLNDIYMETKKGTKLSYWNVYNTNIHYIEEIKNKDLLYFTNEEIRDLFNMSITSSMGTKNNLRTFVKQYFEWALSRGFNAGEGIITMNPCDSLNLKELAQLSDKMMQKTYYSKDEVFEICNDLMKAGKDAQDIIQYVLARYGILGKKAQDIVNLRWEDIDRVNMKVQVLDSERKETLYFVDIDGRFLYYIDLAQNNNCDDYIDNGYVLKIKKSASTDDDGKIANTTLYARVNDIFELLNIERVPLTLLYQSCIIEEMNKLESDKGKIDTVDIKNILTNLNKSFTDSTVTNLKKIYLALYPESIVEDKKRITKSEEETVYVRADRRLKGDDRSRIPVSEYQEYLKKVKIQKLREKEGRLGQED